jgi:hypothetical protein
MCVPGGKKRNAPGTKAMRAGSREFRKELTSSFAVESLPAVHAPFGPANFSLKAPWRALLFCGRGKNRSCSECGDSQQYPVAP